MIRSLTPGALAVIVLALIAPAALAQSDPAAPSGTPPPAGTAGTAGAPGGPPGGPAGGPPGGPPGAEDARYQFTQVDDGTLRLDLKTGQLSLCSRRTVGWACQTVADDRAALEQEIARLQNENVVLKKVLLARGVPLPEGLKPPGAKESAAAPKTPSDAEVDRMMSTVERVWRRLLEMIGSLQKDMMNKT